MSATILYEVELHLNNRKRLLHLQPSGRKIAVVHAKESWAFVSRHYIQGQYLEPDYAAIRAALPYRYRAAFDRITRWWFPASLLKTVSETPDHHNYCRAELWGSRGRYLGCIYATPYVFRQTQSNAN